MKRIVSASIAAASWLVPALASATPSVWVIDDGEKIKEDATSLPFETGADNPVWSPGRPVRLFALRGETVALQVVVEADDAPLEGVTVDLAALVGPGGASIENAAGAADPTRFVGRPIERFVERFLDVAQPSAGKNPRESLGWADGSGPPAGAWLGRVPDALIPVEVAPSWQPYPMRVEPRKNGIVWIDLTVSADRKPGTYRGAIVVGAKGGELAKLPVELEVGAAEMPDRPLKTMLYYDRGALERRIGAADAAERHLWQLLRRHHLTPLHDAETLADVAHHERALDGSIYTPAHGYEGPGAGRGDGLLSLGTYGGFGEPDAAKLARIEEIAGYLAQKRLLESADVFVYATDEDCDSSYGAGWKRLLGQSARAKRVRVAWTCSEDPLKQPVDIPIMLTGFGAAQVEAARAAGKELWAYNGVQPGSGAFLTDAPAVAPRVNGWIAAKLGIGRWFYWESTFWYDDNRGGKGPYDPFATPETFHNKSGDRGMGDGVLVYPGKQVDRFQEHSVGFDGVIASIRLKNWRRGVLDAGYLELARRADRARADAIASDLVPRVGILAREGSPPSWSQHGADFFRAREALSKIIAESPGAGAGPSASAPAAPRAGARPSDGCACRPGRGQAGRSGGALSFLAAALLVARRRRGSPR